MGSVGRCLGLLCIELLKRAQSAGRDLHIILIRIDKLNGQVAQIRMLLSQQLRD